MLSIIVLHTSALKSTNPHATASASSNTGTCFLVDIHSTLSSPYIWIVDSGASRHICSNACIFELMTPLQHATVTLPNQTCISVQFSGDIRFASNLLLKDVLFVPDFKFDLLSVTHVHLSALSAATHVAVNFLLDHFVIQEISSMKKIGRGEKLQGLYILDSHNQTSVPQSMFYANKVSWQVWHNRLSHLFDRRLEMFTPSLPCDGLKHSSMTPCYICPLAKQRKLPFVSHNNKSDFLLI